MLHHSPNLRSRHPGVTRRSAGRVTLSIVLALVCVASLWLLYDELGVQKSLTGALQTLTEDVPATERSNDAAQRWPSAAPAQKDATAEIDEMALAEKGSLSEDEVHRSDGQLEKRDTAHGGTSLSSGSQFFHPAQQAHRTLHTLPIDQLACAP